MESGTRGIVERRMNDEESNVKSANGRKDR
jgi:hypothetical protein